MLFITGCQLYNLSIQLKWFVLVLWVTDFVYVEQTFLFVSQMGIHSFETDFCVCGVKINAEAIW